MRRAAAALVLAAAATAHAAGAPAERAYLLADLPDDVLAKVASRRDAPAQDLLDAIVEAKTAFRFQAAGIKTLTDRRWFEVTSVEGPGAPALEIRRWPGDTVLAFYDAKLEVDPAALVAGVSLAGKAKDVAGWSVRGGRVASPAGSREILWAERLVDGRRVVAVGLPGDAGLGAGAVVDATEALTAVVRRATVEGAGGTASGTLLPPEWPSLPKAADEKKDAWQIFRGSGFTIGLPPGLRALSLAGNVRAPRPMPYASAWLRGRLVDRDGKVVSVGDGTRAGYVASIPQPDEGWRAGVAPPLGAPGAERVDEAALEDLVLEWTGATRAVVSHWREDGFAGDWLVFRLHLPSGGVEIGLPVLAGWRSLALFWIPVTWRGEDRPPAPAPIDPAAGKGVIFRRATPAEKAQHGLVEGVLTVGGLRLDLPLGYWPVATLDSRDGTPVSLLDAAGETVGRIDALDAAGLATLLGDGRAWTEIPRPGTRHAAAMHVAPDGTLVMSSKDGAGYALRPLGSPDAAAWRRMSESASLVRTATRREGSSAPGRGD